MGLIIPERKPQWRRDLSEYIQGVDKTPFRPGKHDCALFCAGAVKAMTGFDGARGWRGYRTLAAGQKKLADAGFNEWWDMLADRECGREELRPGDIAIVDCGELAGGVCLGSHVAVLAPSGRANVRYGKIERGFRI